MSRFYATVQGTGHTEITRGGSQKSGIHCHIRGWDVGVRVYGHLDDNGEDAFEVWATEGSNDPNSRLFLGTVRRKGVRVGFYPFERFEPV